jgi:UPF0271 protein
MKVVFDTSAVLAGLEPHDDEEYFITNEALKEIKDKTFLLKVSLTIKEGKLRVASPKEKSIQRILKKVEELGEEGSLSDADIAALSLALELKEKGGKVNIVTDDYGIQNVAGSLSLSYTPITEKGIKKIIKWHYICTGCGQVYDKNVVYCEICASKVKRRAKR